MTFKELFDKHVAAFRAMSAEEFSDAFVACQALVPIFQAIDITPESYSAIVDYAAKSAASFYVSGERIAVNLAEVDE